MRALVITVLVGCGANAPNVDEVIASHHHERTIAAPAARTMRPWQVGQWALYKVTSGAEVGTLRRAVVAQDTCGLWIETVAQSHHGRTVMKACYRAQPTSADPAAAMDALQAVMVREGTRTIVVDFRDGKNPASKHVMEARLRDSITLAWESPPSEELSTVVVPAGRFEGAAHVISRAWVEQSMHTADAWLHPDVPLGGDVKVTSTDGSTEELLDYGLTGAKSELPTFDEQLANSGLD